MINIEIKASPDSNVVTSFAFFQNQIYLGRTNGDLLIEDNALSASHVMLEVIGKELIIHAQKNVEFFLINGKRASAVRKIKINDLITIGKTILAVTGYEETSRETKKEILDKKLNQLVENNSLRISIIENLTKAMKT